MTPDPKHLVPVLVAWGFSLVVMMFQRDLGADTAMLAGAITRYDPDSAWTPTGDSIESADDTAVTTRNTDPTKEP